MILLSTKIGKHMDNTFYLDTPITIPYAISYEIIPPPSMIGTLQQFPFKLILSACDDGVHTIDLYAQYSKSKPYPEQGKWSHLVPSWRFLDVNQNVITEITTTDTPIYSGTTFIGVTGFAEYYFVDDICSQIGEPTILWATLSVSGLPLYSESNNGNADVPSYANSKVICPIPYYINGGIPSEIKITRNGIDSMSDSTYWINQNIPNVFNIVYDKYPQFGCATDAIGTLFDYPSSNALGIEMGVISSAITTIPTSSQTWTTIDDLAGPYFQKTDTKGYERGGYSRNIVTSNTVTLNTTITAGANVLYSSYKDTPYAWISNPNSALLHKIYYPYMTQTMISNISSWLDGFNINGTNNQYNTEYVTQHSTVMSVSGFGGIYGIAVDPCFNVWCSDAELDKLYKFNNIGELILTVDLSDTTLFNTTGIRGGCTPAGLSLDSENNLWVALFDSQFILKINGLTGELLLVLNLDSKAIDLSNSTIFEGNAQATSNYLTMTLLNSSVAIPLYTYSDEITNTPVTTIVTSANYYEGDTYSTAGKYLTFIVNNSSLAIPLYTYDISGNVQPSTDFNWTNNNTPVSSTNNNSSVIDGTFISSEKYLTLELNNIKYATPLYITVSALNDGIPFDGFIDPLYKPTTVDTDLDNNIWVSYTNTLCSCLFKYDTNGIILSTIGLPLCSNPMDIIVDSDNSVWISLTYHASPSGGSVNKYSSIGTPLCTIPAYHPEYLTLDNDNHLWFTSDFNVVNRVDLNTCAITTSSIGISADPDFYNGQINYNALEGLAADSSNRIWVINAMESSVFVLSGNFTTVSKYNLSTNRIDQIAGTDFNQYDIDNPYEKSLQSFGDWTGLRWQQKYGRTRQMHVTGCSDPFDIDDFIGYDIRKFNESWDVTTQLRDYALNESFHEDYNLFENYIGTMIGGLETSAKSMARALYEKIANFVPNNADADVCGINQLYSLAQSIDVPIDDYNFVIPSELKRLMDIVSIDHKILWGDHCKCAENYRGSWGYCSNCGHKHDSNRGDAVDADTYILSAGVPILAEYKYGRDYYEKLVPITTYSNTYITSSINIGVTGYAVSTQNTYLTSLSVSVVSPMSFDIYPDFTYTHSICAVPHLYYPSGITYYNPLPVSANLYVLSSFRPDDVLMVDYIDAHILHPHSTEPDVLSAGSFLKNVASGGSVNINIRDTYGINLGIMSGAGIHTLPWSQYAVLQWNPTQLLSTYAVSSISTTSIWITGSIITSSVNILSTVYINNYTLYNYASTYLLNDPSYYCYYEYIPTPCNIQIEGVINWSDEYTTLSENISGLDDWYGNNQNIEKMINYTLHKGLGF